MLTDILAILFLVVLEGLLSFDNALALAAMVKPLPQHLQKKALTYGIYGAFIFRFIAVFLLLDFLHYPLVKLAGGSYLVWLGIKHLLIEEDEQAVKTITTTAFIQAIVMVELTDIAFSIDSILAAVAVSSKTYIVVTGGIIGIIMMRFASTIFIKLIDIFPRLVTSAFLLVTAVGLKLLLEVQPLVQINFHEGAAAIGFWLVMIAALAYGFTEKQAKEQA